MRAPRVERAGVVETGVSREEARRVAGAADDPLKVVEDLPGVARAAVGTGDIIVWGAAPADTRVVFDGVELPALFHVGGWRSTVPAGLVSRVSLTPGGFGAEWGRALGGLVRVEGVPPPPPGFHGEVGADLLDGAALLSYARGRFALTVAGRYSWLDRAAAAVVQGDAAAFIPLPRWDDYQLRASVALARHERLTLTFLAADDSLRREVSTGDPTAVHSDELERSTLPRCCCATRSSATAPPSRSRRSSATTPAAPSTATAPRRPTSTCAPGRPGCAPPIAAASAASSSSPSASTSSTRTPHVTRLGSLTIPPREGDLYVFGQPPGDDVAASDDAIHQLDVAPFVSVDVRLGPVTVTPGLRVDALLAAEQPPRAAGRRRARRRLLALRLVGRPALAAALAGAPARRRRRRRRALPPAAGAGRSRARASAIPRSGPSARPWPPPASRRG